MVPQSENLMAVQVGRQLFVSLTLDERYGRWQYIWKILQWGV